MANLVARQTDQTFLAAVVPAEVIALTNTQREVNNVGTVADNALLGKAAQAKAQDMALNGYFSHVGPGGKTPWQWISESGYQYQYAGENLAVRFIDSQDVVNAWMESPTHRANIVKPVYTQIGVGVAQGLYEGQPATYVVQYFASPAISAVIASRPSVAVATTAPVPSSPAANVQTAVQSAQQPSQVEGASVEPAAAQSNAFTQTLTRLVTRVAANPQQSTSWILGAISTLLIVVLLFTFFVHVGVQPANMLIKGSLVAILAVSFLTVNAHLAEGVPVPGDSQAAGVIEAVRPGSVVIGEKAESTSYALFPLAPEQ